MADTPLTESECKGFAPVEYDGITNTVNYYGECFPVNSDNPWYITSGYTQYDNLLRYVLNTQPIYPFVSDAGCDRVAIVGEEYLLDTISTLSTLYILNNTVILILTDHTIKLVAIKLPSTVAVLNPDNSHIFQIIHAQMTPTDTTIATDTYTINSDVMVRIVDTQRVHSPCIPTSMVPHLKTAYDRWVLVSKNAITVCFLYDSTTRTYRCHNQECTGMYNTYAEWCDHARCYINRDEFKYIHATNRTPHKFKTPNANILTVPIKRRGNKHKLRFTLNILQEHTPTVLLTEAERKSPARLRYVKAVRAIDKL